MTWNKRTWMWLAAGASIVVLLAGSGLVLAYGIYRAQWDDVWVRQIPMVGALPVARVDGRTVEYRDYLLQLDAARTFLSGPAAKAQGLSPEITAEVKSLSYERAIRIAAIDALAAREQLVVTPLDVDRAYDGLVAYAGSSTTSDEVQAFLRDQFGWDIPSFKQHIVRPALIEDTLKQRSLAASNDAGAFDRELEAFLQGEDVVRYVRF